VIAIQSLVERLATAFAEGENKLEAVRAREDYFERAGRVFDDDGELFESRMAAFLEWYIIERNLADGPPPALRVLAAPPGRFTDDERRAAVHLATSHRSLFELVSMTDGRLEMDDLIGGARFGVVERRSTIGFEPGALFEARLLWDGEAVVFGKTFLFHPPDARARVLQMVDKATDAGTPAVDLMFQLSRLYVRWHRFGHLSAAKIYAGDA
jgi:plasmid stability protein